LGGRLSVVKEAPIKRGAKRVVMAAEGDAKELNVHRVGYERFVTLIKWSTAACLITALIVIFLIAE
jgi:hypothetical protein